MPPICSCPNYSDPCPAGFVTNDTGCCRLCVLATSTSCAQGMINYQGFLQTEQYMDGHCDTDADCGVALGSNACGANCGIPTNAAFTTALAADLAQYAANNCASCPAQPEPQCPFMGPVKCLGGQCAFEPITR